MEKHLQQINTQLQRSNELLTVISKTLLSDALKNEVKNKKMAKLYELTGSDTRDEISKKIGMSAGAISAVWQRWETLGLLIKDGKSYRRIF